MKKIIFLDHENLTIRRKETFCLDAIVQAGFEIEFWDLTVYNVHMRNCDEVQESYLRTFTSKKDVIKTLRQQDVSNTIFVVEFTYGWKYIDLLRFFSKNNCITIRIDLYATIFSVPKESAIKKVFKSRLSYIPIQIGRFIKASCFKLYCKLSKIDLTYKHKLTSDSNDTTATGLINHQDWQRISKLLEKERPSDIPFDPYVVFVDQYYPLHPDFKRNNVGKLGNEITYQNELNRFFDLLERDLGLRVIVCAHPKAVYKEATFNGRSIYKYRTEEFIKYSQGAIIHNSLAVVYPIAFNKPILLMTNNEHKQTITILNHQQRYEQILRIPITNTSRIDRLQESPFTYIDDDVKEKIVYGYLTSLGNEKRENSDLIISYLSKL